jgi:hypothetical protein
VSGSDCSHDKALPKQKMMRCNDAAIAYKFVKKLCSAAGRSNWFKNRGNWPGIPTRYTCLFDTLCGQPTGSSNAESVNEVVRRHSSGSVQTEANAWWSNESCSGRSSAANAAPVVLLPLLQPSPLFSPVPTLPLQRNCAHTQHFQGCFGG